MKNPEVPRLLRMDVLSYHFDLQLRCYPSSVQKQMIVFNASNDCFLYKMGKGDVTASAVEIPVEASEICLLVIVIFSFKYYRRKLVDLSAGEMLLFSR